MTLKKWAEELNQQVYKEWKTKYDFWEPGFKVFFSPVYKNPKLMILSLNPGGTKVHYENENMRNFQKNDFSLPKHNEYLTKDHNMANKVKLFFEGHYDLLEQSVVLPIVFFRSQNWKYWKNNVPKNKRREMEQFSYDLVKEIIEKLKPKMFLVLGISSTYRRIKKNILDVKNEKSVLSGIHRLYITAQAGNIPIFCIPHLTGYRLSNEKREKIRNSFFRKSNM